jgi:A/G-specific adenine glycosylase
LSSFSSRLLQWFDEYGRKDLPWQQGITAYRVWVSEIMLQQTQVQTVIPYFNRFIASFPDIATLADAPQDSVLSHWSGLGYYARARNLHKAAQQIRDQHSGEFPSDYDDVLELPGIGRSTAGAILSIAHQQRHAILDGNVKRVLARHETIEGWPGKSAVLKDLWIVAERNTPQSRVADYTQGIMDLGATLCTRTRPSCERCPVRHDCAALQADTVSDYPGRKPKVAKPLRHTTMILASVNGQVYLEKRPEAGIWGGLWSLPELDDRGVQDWCNSVLGSAIAETVSWSVLRHSFSHYDLDIQPIVVRVASSAGTVADTDAGVWHELDAPPPGGIAAPVKKLIDQLKKSENVSHS